MPSDLIKYDLNLCSVFQIDGVPRLLFPFLVVAVDFSTTTNKIGLGTRLDTVMDCLFLGSEFKLFSFILYSSLYYVQNLTLNSKIFIYES